MTWGSAGQGSDVSALPSSPCPSPYSVAKSLGAKTVAARTLECAKECEILSEVVEDQEAVKAVQRFLGECNPGRLSTATLSPASEAGLAGQ